jgi:hypothetical protein
MELINISPLAGMSYCKYGPRGEAWQVAVVRGSFTLTPGQPLQFADEALDLVMADVYQDADPTTSALRHETDLVWTKPACDVVVAGHAHAPLGRAAARWLAGVQLGKQRHSLTVTGPRQWRKRGDGWFLDEPQATSRVALDYALAFGGDPSLGQEAAPGALPDNPLGVGYYKSHHLDSAQTYAAPQFETTGQPYEAFDRLYPVLGFSPLSRWWPSRYRHAGTLDAAWEKSGFPYLPDDFDIRFYNGAPEALQVPHPQGGESLVLVGLWPTSDAAHTRNAHGTVLADLPGSFPEAEIQTISSIHPPRPMTLDTIVIDTDACRVYLTWRITVAQSQHPQNCIVRWPMWQQAQIRNRAGNLATNEHAPAKPESAVAHG